MLINSVFVVFLCSDEGDTSSSSSNEAGRSYDEIIPLTVPPPSPSVQTQKKSTKPKVIQPRGKLLTKSANVSRKPLPVN